MVGDSWYQTEADSWSGEKRSPWVTGFLWVLSKQVVMKLQNWVPRAILWETICMKFKGMCRVKRTQSRGQFSVTRTEPARRAVSFAVAVNIQASDATATQRPEEIALQDACSQWVTLVNGLLPLNYISASWRLPQNPVRCPGMKNIQKYQTHLDGCT